jgi:hypothetical protein
MPVIALLLIALVVALVWQNRELRAAVLRRPGQAVFWALVCIAVALISFRIGRHYLALVAVLLFAWGPRLLRMLNKGAPPPTGAPPSGRASRGMTREEALEVLGLDEGATPEQIAAQYRTLMKSVHPDKGGSGYLAKRVNEAKRVLSRG